MSGFILEQRRREWLEMRKLLEKRIDDDPNEPYQFPAEKVLDGTVFGLLAYNVLSEEE